MKKILVLFTFLFLASCGRCVSSGCTNYTQEWIDINVNSVATGLMGWGAQSCGSLTANQLNDSPTCNVYWKP